MAGEGYSIDALLAEASEALDQCIRDGHDSAYCSEVYYMHGRAQIRAILEESGEDTGNLLI